MKRKFLIIPAYDRLDETMALARQYDLGFEYNDFFDPRIYSDRQELETRCRTYRALQRDRSLDTLHGAFLDLAITSRDTQIRSYSRERVVQSLRIGERLGVRGVVFHSGLIAGLRTEAYLDGWLYESEAFWRIMAKSFSGMAIYLENSFEESPELLLRLKENMADVKNVQLCLDYGHAALTPTPLTEWAGRMEGVTGHLHLNDHDGRADLHLPPGEGTLDFGQCKQLLDRHFPGLPVLLELNGIEAQRRALAYMTRL